MDFRLVVTDDQKVSFFVLWFTRGKPCNLAKSQQDHEIKLSTQVDFSVVFVFQKFSNQWLDISNLDTKQTVKN